MLKTISKDTYVSITLAVMIFGYVARTETAINTTYQKLEYQAFRLEKIEELLERYDERFITRDETLLRLDAIIETLDELKRKK